MKKNIFLALDFNSLDKALKITQETKDYLAGIKIGLELYSVIGLKGVKEFEKFRIPIFLDTKIFDIPNQVAKTIKIISEIKSIKYFTIHSLGSLEMLQSAQKAATNTNLEFLAVSVLTSWDKKNLEEVGITSEIKDQVKLHLNKDISHLTDWCDTSYDNVTDTWERLNKVVSIIKDNTRKDYEYSL